MPKQAWVTKEGRKATVLEAKRRRVDYDRTYKKTFDESAQPVTANPSFPHPLDYSGTVYSSDLRWLLGLYKYRVYPPESSIRYRVELDRCDSLTTGRAALVQLGKSLEYGLPGWQVQLVDDDKDLYLEDALRDMADLPIYAKGKRVASYFCTMLEKEEYIRVWKERATVDEPRGRDSSMETEEEARAHPPTLGDIEGRLKCPRAESNVRPGKKNTPCTLEDLPAPGIPPVAQLAIRNVSLWALLCKRHVAGSSWPIVEPQVSTVVERVSLRSARALTTWTHGRTGHCVYVVALWGKQRVLLPACGRAEATERYKRHLQDRTSYIPACQVDLEVGQAIFLPPFTPYALVNVQDPSIIAVGRFHTAGTLAMSLDGMATELDGMPDSSEEYSSHNYSELGGYLSCLGDPLLYTPEQQFLVAAALKDLCRRAEPYLPDRSVLQEEVYGIDLQQWKLMFFIRAGKISKRFFQARRNGQPLKPTDFSDIVREMADHFA